MDFGLKAVFSGLAVLLTLMAFVPYIASILKNEIKKYITILFSLRILFYELYWSKNSYK